MKCLFINVAKFPCQSFPQQQPKVVSQFKFYKGLAYLPSCDMIWVFEVVNTGSNTVLAVENDTI